MLGLFGIPMIRSHATNNDSIDLNRTYEITKGHMKFKPDGFWYSINFDWNNWCKYNNFNIGKNNFEFDLDMTDILFIEDKNQIQKLPIITDSYSLSNFAIDWLKVKKKYKGFELINQNCMRLDLTMDVAHSMFAYTLDCDGGCIWDLSAISNVREVKPQGHINE